MTRQRTRNSLREDQVSLLHEVLEKRAPDALATLLPKVEANSLSREERHRVCDLIGAELAETGFDANSEPLARGLKLEDLLDVINRPNLSLDDATAGLPPRARPPLAVCAAAALIGGLALFAATRREFGESGLLLLLGWTGVAVAAVAALVFAARSGRLDGAEPAEQPRTVAQDRGAEPWDRAARLSNVHVR